MTLIVINLCCILVAAILSVKDRQMIGHLLRSRETQRVEDTPRAVSALVRILAFVGVAVTALWMAVEHRAAEDRRAAAEAHRQAAEEEARESIKAVHSITRSLEEQEKKTREGNEREKKERRQREQAEAQLARRYARLQVSWNPLAGRSIDATKVTAPVTVTQEMVQDRKEYRLSIVNPSGYRLADASLSIEFPYPLESSELAGARGITGLVFQPIGGRFGTVPIRGGTIQVNPGGCTWSYAMTIAEVRPDAVLEVVLRLYSGDRVPEAQAGGIHWRYRYEVGSGWATRSFSAPFVTPANKIVALGPQHSAPWTPPPLSVGFANCARP